MSPKRIPRFMWSRWHRFWVWLESPRGGAIMQIIGAGGLLALALIFFFYSSTTHKALCTLRSDLKLRVERTEKYLNQYPGDFRLGSIIIPREQLVGQVTSQKATLRSLDSLNC